MAISKEKLNHNRAALFDWLVVLISFTLGFTFPTLGDFIRSPLFYNMMLVSLLLYLAGAALKHLPLSYRLSTTGKNIRPVPYVIFLVIGHWFIIFFMVIVSEPAFRSLIGMPAFKQGESASWQVIVSANFLSTFGTWLAYRNKLNRRFDKAPDPVRLYRQEMLADILLVAGVSIISFIFWEKGIMGMLDRVDKKSIGTIIFLFFFLAALFVFFYLPMRYLFFIEDREGGRNRKRLFLIFGFILLKALFEMLRI
ncbi:MAG: hypothetical protein IPP99_21230 [Chitinophagaceae bacterium]|nr:hypothetical protein [Chitinophagaceae bacterium]